MRVYSFVMFIAGITEFKRRECVVLSQNPHHTIRSLPAVAAGHYESLYDVTTIQWTSV